MCDAKGEIVVSSRAAHLSPDSSPERTTRPSRWCRTMSRCFSHNRRIRHKLSDSDCWIGRYDSVLDKIVFNEQTSSLNKFVSLHYKRSRPDRTSNANAWAECECETPSGAWNSIFNLTPNANV